MGRWTIPEPLHVDWPMRAVSTAKITKERLGDGRVRRTIEHAPIPGVTTEMFLWFLEHVPRTLRWRNQEQLAYRYWHPRDHIFFERIGPFAAGARFHIVEAFQAKPEYLMDLTFDVLKLDRTGFVMEHRALGITVAQMDERIVDSPAGLRMTVIQTVGTATPIVRRLATLMLQRKEAMLDAWMQHNVEEDGTLQHFLPELYATYVVPARAGPETETRGRQ